MSAVCLLTHLKMFWYVFSTGYVRPRSNSIGVTRAKQDHNSNNTKRNIRPRPATPIRIQRYNSDSYKSIPASSSAEPNNNNTSSTTIISKTTTNSENNFRQKIQQNTEKIIPPEVVVDQQQHICELYSDTLDQCFDKTGIYVCKSYGPRCYIIQKVIKTPTT